MRNRDKDNFTSFVVIYTLRPNFPSSHLPRLHKNQDDFKSKYKLINKDDVVLAIDLHIPIHPCYLCLKVAVAMNEVSHLGESITQT